MKNSLIYPCYFSTIAFGGFAVLFMYITGLIIFSFLNGYWHLLGPLATLENMIVPASGPHMRFKLQHKTLSTRHQLSSLPSDVALNAQQGFRMSPIGSIVLLETLKPPLLQWRMCDGRGLSVKVDL